MGCRLAATFTEVDPGAARHTGHAMRLPGVGVSVVVIADVKPAWVHTRTGPVRSPLPVGV